MLVKEIAVNYADTPELFQLCFLPGAHLPSLCVGVRVDVITEELCLNILDWSLPTRELQRFCDSQSSWAWEYSDCLPVHSPVCVVLQENVTMVAYDTQAALFKGRVRIPLKDPLCTLPLAEPASAAACVHSDVILLSEHLVQVVSLSEWRITHAMDTARSVKLLARAPVVIVQACSKPDQSSSELYF
eukprot:Colp12_sorted_trinity150504_noHs@22853